MELLTHISIKKKPIDLKSHILIIKKISKDSPNHQTHQTIFQY